MSNTRSTSTHELTVSGRVGVRDYVSSGAPYVWLTASAIAVSIIITVALLALTAVRGIAHFWPADLLEASYVEPGHAPFPVLAEVRSSEEVTVARLINAGIPVSEDQDLYQRLLLKVGNRDIYGADFRYVLDEWMQERSYPEDATVWERVEWGNLHGFLERVTRDGEVIATRDQRWDAYRDVQKRANGLREEIREIEKDRIGAVNYKLERLRLAEKRLQLDGKSRASDAPAFAKIDAERDALKQRYDTLNQERGDLYRELGRDSITVRTIDGDRHEIPLSKLISGWQPNRMNVFHKTGFWLEHFWEFISDDPREANTEGGIFPAIFGTVLMVILMSIFVTPFGILAALYLREYAAQGPVTRAIRIAVNNLAGVPSIVYGMFGLGFFVYFLGGSIDRLFYPEAAPAPVFGTPGLMWSSLTLALLTLPVVIVATEEGLARIPRSIREASLALGATKAETLWRVVLPMSSPAMMTGLILAIARAAGETAPLMLVGVVKLAPNLPIDGNFPFFHFERKFMHLGFHIYDVGFQSPNVEAARPLVYATSFLLVMVIVILNIAAITIRNRLRERYKALEH